MFKWLAQLFAGKCPACKSTDIYERNVFTMTYFIYYACRACGHEWKEYGN